MILLRSKSFLAFSFLLFDSLINRILNFRCDEKEITVNDLFLLCDLFYLPFEHGSRSLQIINEFYWLKSNATVLISSYKKGQDLSSAKPEVRDFFSFFL